MVVFKRNWLIKLYYLLALFALIMFVLGSSMAHEQWFTTILLLVILFFSIRVFTDKVIIEKSKITSKTMLSEKSIVIKPHSLIYIKRSSFTFNFVLRINSYSIRIENSPDDILKINADVQNPDELFEQIQNLEQSLITPKVVDTFIKNSTIKMKDMIVINQEGFEVGNKAFKYNDIKAIKIKNGNFVVLGEGRMWDRTLLTKPIYDIPNLHTNLVLLGQFTSIG